MRERSRTTAERAADKDARRAQVEVERAEARTFWYGLCGPDGLGARAATDLASAVKSGLTRNRRVGSRP